MNMVYIDDFLYIVIPTDVFRSR